MQRSFVGLLTIRFSPLYFALKMERGDAERQRGEAIFLKISKV
jgi:hypothetical protein